MEQENINNISVNEQASSSSRGIDPSVEPILEEMGRLMESGVSLEEVIVGLSQQGVQKETISSALSYLGYSPDAVVDLFQKIEIALNQQQEAQMQKPQEQNYQENMSPEESAYMAQEEANMMQYGGNTTSRGFLDQIPNQTARPLYMPPVPARGNLIGAAMMLSDFVGEMGSKEDRNKDGLMDGSFRDWDAKNKRYKQKQLNNRSYELSFKENDFKYGGDLPKAQIGIPDYSNISDFVSQYSLPNMGNYLKNQNQTNYAADTQAVKDSQLQQKQPDLGATPLDQEQQRQQNMFADQNMQSRFQPQITRKRNLSNAFDQAEDFIKYNPTMQAFGKVSEGAVMGANFVNELFKEKEYNDYTNKLRNSTMADKVYGAIENPVNKRGTFDKNSGFAEPDNLVNFLAQAMYGKEMYKAGGEFKPHMMFDPVSGKGYEANIEADHNRFSKLGFLHQDEMQKGGEIEVDNDTLASLIAAGADIEIL